MSIAQRIPNSAQAASALSHSGGSRVFLDRHRIEVATALAEGGQHLNELNDSLLVRIADERNLKIAWDHLARYGGQASGPNGHRFVDYSSHEVRSLMRCIGVAILNDTYRSGPVRRCRIGKISGHGYRTLSIQNIEDRAVGRAVTQIIQPLLDPTFEPTSSGYRPGLSRIDALADALRLTAEGRTVSVSDDCANAFDGVPNNRLKDIVRRKLPDNVSGLIGRTITSGGRRGIPQGSPLSPLLLNVYLDHLVDKPWRTRHPDIPLLRHADDLLFCCDRQTTAQSAYIDLNRMLTSAGMRLKGVASSVIRDLSRGNTTTWLGYQVSSFESGLQITIADNSWRALTQNLTLAHYKTCSSLVADAVIAGWLDQHGPTFEHEDRESVCQRITAIANQRAFEEIPPRSALLGIWQRSFDRWQERSHDFDSMSSSITSPDSVVGGIPF